MKKIYKNIIAVFLILAVFSLCIYGFMSAKLGFASDSIKAKDGKEILIAKDVGGGRPLDFIRWCGNEALIIRDDNFVTKWIGLKGNRITISEKSGDSPLNCTPDGEWFIYEDRESVRMYTDKEGEPPEPIVDDGEADGWQELVMDIYRYEIATGKRQKFAVVHEDSGSLVSPDGSRVLILNREDSTIDMPEPKWEAVWLKNEWEIFSKVIWFADSSGAVTRRGGGSITLGIELFGKNGWSETYSAKSLGLNRGQGYSVSLEAVDNEKRIYLIAHDTFWVSENRSKTKYRLLRCTIKDKRLSYEELNELDDNGMRIFPVNILLDGSFIYSPKGENRCIYRLKPGDTEPECIADTQYDGETYEYIRLLSVSPDGRRIAFTRENKRPNPVGRFYTNKMDLFVKEIPE